MRFVVLADVVAGDVAVDVVHQQQETVVLLAVVVLEHAVLAVEIEVVGLAVTVLGFAAGVVNLVELHHSSLAAGKPASRGMGPPVLVAGKVEITGTQAGTMDFVILDEPAVGTAHDDAVTAQVVHVVAADNQRVAGAAGDDAGLVDAFDAVAFDQDVAQAGLLDGGTCPAYSAVDEYGRIPSPGSAHLSPDVVDEIVRQGDVREFQAGFIDRHHYAAAPHSQLRLGAARNLEVLDGPATHIVEEYGLALGFIGIDHRTALSEGGKDYGLVGRAASLEDELSVPGFASLEEYLVARLEGGGVNIVEALPRGSLRKAGGSIVSGCGNIIRASLRRQCKGGDDGNQCQYGLFHGNGQLASKAPMSVLPSLRGFPK